MKKLLVASVVMAVGFVVPSVSFANETFTPPAGSELREGEIHPDWATLCATGAVSIPNDETWVAYEADMAAINTLPEGKLTIYPRGTLVLDNTTTWFSKGNLVNYNCKGTVVKRGASTLQQTTSQYNIIDGRLVIENGVLETKTHYPVDGSATATIEVKPGATLNLAFGATLGAARLLVGGDGYNHQGAIIFGNGTVARLELTEDTTIVQNSANRSFSSYTNPGSGRFATVNPATIEMNDHTLTIAGSSTSLGFSQVAVTGGGAIVVSPLANNATRTFMLSGRNNLDNLGSLTLPANAVCQFRNSASPVRACGTTLVAQGDLSFTFGDDGWSVPPAGSEDYCHWTGPIQMADGATLSILPTADSRQFSFTGDISGAANVQIGTSSSVAKGVVLLGGNNSYTGTTKVYGSTTFQVYLRTATSVPDFSKLTVSGGSVYPSVAHDALGQPTWTAESILNLSTNLNQTTVKIDATKLTSTDELSFSPAMVANYYPALNNVWDCLGTTGGYTLTGPYTEEKPLNLNVLGGTVRLTGAETINLGQAVVSGKSAESSGTLILDGASDVRYTNQTFTIGSASTSLTTPVAHMVITNSTLISTHKSKGEEIYESTLFVGQNAAGVLDIEAGSVISNKLIVGGGKSFSSGDGIGAVNQFGGSVYVRCAGEAHLSSNIGNAGHGSYYLEDGLFRTLGSLVIGGYSSAVFRQVGGSARFAGNCAPSGSNGGQSEMSILGGTLFLINKAGNWVPTSGTSGMMVATVSGADTVLSVTNSQYGYLYNLNSTGDVRSIYNLNDGGTIESLGFYCYKDTYQNVDPLIINFNGGILRSFGGSQFRANGSKFPARVVIEEKGAIFDTRGSSYTSTWSGELTAPVEGGVQSVAMPEGGITTYFPAIPRVKIDGAGLGASAIALWNPRTGMVTNILVTSHGWGYDAASTTVRLVYYGNSTRYTFAKNLVTIGPNEIGGLTKTGPQDLVLYNTNTWAKWTRVLGGTLKAGCDKAIPSGTALTLSNGGVLDLNSKQEPTFTGLDGTGGSVVNGTVRLTGDMEVSANRFIDRVTTEVTGPVDFTAVTSVTLTDTELLDAAAEELRGLYLIKGASLTFGATKPTILGVPTGWQLSWRPDGLRLNHPKGLAIIVR